MHWEHFPTTDSTNTQALAWVDGLSSDETNEPKPRVFVADEQTQGRGRLGRVWRSGPGGAWFSLAWPVPASSQGSPGQGALPLVAGLAVCDVVVHAAVEHAQALRPALKWPNDVLLEGRKLAGVLCEQRLARPGSSWGWVVIGIGINVNNAVQAEAVGMRRPPVALGERLQTAVLVEPLVRRAVDSLQIRLAQLNPEGLSDSARREAESLLWAQGRAVQLRQPDGDAGAGTTARVVLSEGRLDGLEPDGALRLIDDAGAVHRAVSGELHVMESEPNPVTSVTSVKE